MNGKNSLERVLALLDAFTEDRLEWTSDELMAALGYSRPTLYRYLKGLREAGFLTSMPSGGFMLGPRVVEMDYLMRKADTLAGYAQSYLEAFARTYPCVALLVRWYGNKLLVVASECVTPGLENDYPRGRPLPIARGANSRAIMAHLTRRKLVSTLEANRGEFEAVGLEATVEELTDELRQIRKRGYAIAYGEITRGMTGVAAPVFDGGSSPVAALSVTLAGDLSGSEEAMRIGAKLREAAAELSERLAADRHRDGPKS